MCGENVALLLSSKISLKLNFVDSYLVKTEITFNTMGCEEDLAFACKNNQEPVQCLKHKLKGRLRLRINMNKSSKYLN